MNLQVTPEAVGGSPQEGLSLPFSPSLPTTVCSCHGAAGRPPLTSCPCFPAVRVSPCHSRQPSVISDASAAEGDRSSTPSDINSPRHRTHSLCNVRPAAAGSGHCGGPGGAGGRAGTHLLFPLAHPGNTLAKAFPVLSFPFPSGRGCGERETGGPLAPRVWAGTAYPEEGGPRSPTGSVQAASPPIPMGPVQDRGSSSQLCPCASSRVGSRGGVY